MGREPVTGTGSLRLPQDVGVAQSTATALEIRWDTIDRVDDELAQAGMLPNTEPPIEWRPITPELLMTADIKDFTTLFSQQLLWSNYAKRLLADVRAHKLQIDNQMVDIEMEKRDHWQRYNKTVDKIDRMSNPDIEMVTHLDPTYRELRLVQQTLEQKRIKLDAWVEELENGLRTVSRQIENRRTEFQNGGRAQNMSSHASGRWDPKTSGTP